jgi:release factor glutamine methyltransferase
MTYEPMMTPSAARQRLAWQDGVYQRNRRRPKRTALVLHGRRFVVSEQVFAPVAERYNLLARVVRDETLASDVVLDLGTGSGVQGIMAAAKGGRVTAVDVNPYAVRCARLNARRNGLASRMRAVEGDLFGGISRRFDLIVLDPPFRWSRPRDLWERSTADENYGTLRAFFANAKRHLRPRGRILIHFGTSADMMYLHCLIRRHRFRPKEVARASNSGWTYFVYRLTP